ncbi:DUF1033 family protein [Macrococcoides caseolyticum]|uniref:DUF1033 family protein n=1 Tax=Macrococcoides caseolyticum TaxID=69966 RepID=UPI001F2E7675|nr:DUF1033 family protein [Macrococcus caseolyticus]MCE4957000.1 DUF1033 family protein [Macrococcus caseolyticus]
MYEIITIRADYEGWWLFDDFRDQATDIQAFQTFEQAEAYYKSQLKLLRQHFCNEMIGKYNIHAFYNNCEIEFCESCDDEVQIFHSIIFLKQGEVFQYTQA